MSTISNLFRSHSHSHQHSESQTVVDSQVSLSSSTSTFVAPSQTVFVDYSQVSSDVVGKTDYGATQLIKLLIQYIGQDLTSFQHYNDVSFNILKTSQNIWFGINKLITDVAALDQDIEAWQKYVTYTGAIDPLEEFLFKFSLLTEQQTMLYRQFEEFVGVNECMTLIDTFKSQREELLRSVKSLKSSEVHTTVMGGSGWTSKEEHCCQVVTRHADVSFFTLFLERIKISITKVPVGSRTTLTKCYNELMVVYEILKTEFGKDRIQEEFFFMAITTVITVYSTVQMTLRPKDFPEWADEHKCMTIWESTTHFCEGFVRQINSVKPDYTVIEEIFITIAITIGITVFRGRPITSPRPTPSPGPKGPVVVHDPTGPVVIHDPKGPVEDPKKQPHGPTNPHPSPKPEWTFKITFTQLLKQVSYVRRPYHAQAVALVSICYALYRTWTTTTTKTKEMFAAIEVAFQETFTVLQACGSSVLDVRIFASSFDVDNAEVKKIRQMFAAAQLKIKACFELYHIHDWMSYEVKLTKAFEEDKTRMQQLKEFLTKPGHQGSPEVKPGELIEVTVDIHLKSRHLEERKMFVKPNTRLFAVMWEACQELRADHKIHCADSCTSKFRDEKNRDIAMDSMLSSLTIVKNEKCWLRLFLGDSA